MAERDVDTEMDLFDRILFSEESVINSGQSEGEKQGERDATLKSFSDGIKEGGDLASEIGFYSGVCEGILQNRTQLEDKYNDRAWSRVVKLSERITKLEIKVKEDGICLEEMVTHIRDEFKVIVSKFKLQINFKKSPQNEL